jgi:PQQ-like domain
MAQWPPVRSVGRPPPGPRRRRPGRRPATTPVDGRRRPHRGRPDRDGAGNGQRRPADRPGRRQHRRAAARPRPGHRAAALAQPAHPGCPHRLVVPPNVAGGRIYLGGGNSRIYSIDAATRPGGLALVPGRRPVRLRLTGRRRQPRVRIRRRCHLGQGRGQWRQPLDRQRPLRQPHQPAVGRWRPLVHRERRRVRERPCGPAGCGELRGKALWTVQVPATRCGARPRRSARRPSSSAATTASTRSTPPPASDAGLRSSTSPTVGCPRPPSPQARLRQRAGRLPRRPSRGAPSTPPGSQPGGEILPALRATPGGGDHDQAEGRPK